MDTIQNPGSAFGEAVGAYMELVLNEYLADFVSQFNCHLITRRPKDLRTQKEKKLLLYDNYGTAYNIDAVITNESMQPLILLESKYIRYKKHNRDKGSWLCTAHNAVRRRYNSVRSSIAVLAGSWSNSSLAMMNSHDVNVFLIPFNRIVDLLSAHGIKFDWGEKDRNVAIESWHQYQQLTTDQRKQIAELMIVDIKAPLEAAIKRTLDNTTPRAVENVSIEIRTNIGEVKRFEFASITEALDFLEDFTMEEMLNNADSFTLFDQPRIIPDDDEPQSPVVAMIP